MTRRICAVITARPSYSRVRTALAAVQEHPTLELQLVVAASALLDRYGAVVNQIEADGFKVAHKVFMLVEGENTVSMAKTTGMGIIELATVIDNLKPDCVVTVADRYETLATAVAASYLNRPLAHIQGGEVTGSIDEKVRHAITKLANLHLVSSTPAAERVIRMGEERSSVHVTGCPSIDIAAKILDAPDLDFDPFERYGGVGPRFDLSNGYLVVLQHPVTTEHDQALHDVLETLEAVHEAALPTLWFWPNPDAGSDGTSKGIRQFRELRKPNQMHFFRNMSPEDFLRLILGARCLLGNSSVGIRESGYLRVPVVNIGSRQSGRDRGANVIDVAHDRHAILTALKKQLANPRPRRDTTYGDGNAGARIASVLASAPLRIEKRLTYD